MSPWWWLPVGVTVGGAAGLGLLARAAAAAAVDLTDRSAALRQASARLARASAAVGGAPGASPPPGEAPPLP